MIFAVDDLAQREAGPAPGRLSFGPAGDRASLDRYLAAWRRWRAIRRDASLTEAEWEAKISAVEWAVARRVRAR